jgi:hypothetical protein
MRSVGKCGVRKCQSGLCRAEDLASTYVLRPRYKNRVSSISKSGKVRIMQKCGNAENERNGRNQECLS